MQNVVVDEAGIEGGDYENKDEGMFEDVNDNNGISLECSSSSSESVESSSSDDSEDPWDSDGFSRPPFADDVKTGQQVFPRTYLR